MDLIIRNRNIQQFQIRNDCLTNADWEVTQVSESMMDLGKKIQKYIVYLADQSGFSISLTLGQIPYYEYDKVI